MAAHLQLSLDIAEKDRTLRNEADTALVEQQTFLLAQMDLRKKSCKKFEQHGTTTETVSKNI